MINYRHNHIHCQLFTQLKRVLVILLFSGMIFSAHSFEHQYIVKQGDQLGSILLSLGYFPFSKNRDLLKRVAQINNLNKNYSLTIGTKLYLPLKNIPLKCNSYIISLNEIGIKKMLFTQDDFLKRCPSPTRPDVWYRVQKGDTLGYLLYSIGQKSFHKSGVLSQVTSRNQLSSANKIYMGQTLFFQKKSILFHCNVTITSSNELILKSNISSNESFRQFASNTSKSCDDKPLRSIASTAPDEDFQHFTPSTSSKEDVKRSTENTPPDSGFKRYGQLRVGSSLFYKGITFIDNSNDAQGNIYSKESFSANFSWDQFWSSRFSTSLFANFTFINFQKLYDRTFSDRQHTLIGFGAAANYKFSPWLQTSLWVRSSASPFIFAPSATSLRFDYSNTFSAGTNIELKLFELSPFKLGISGGLGYTLPTKLESYSTKGGINFQYGGFIEQALSKDKKLRGEIHFRQKNSNTNPFNQTEKELQFKIELRLKFGN